MARGTGLFRDGLEAIGGFVKGAKILMGRFARNQFESDLPCSASSG
jgi:hypothetical protein